MLNLALANSKLHVLNGTMSVETFGAEEGNLIQINLPMNKQTEG